METLAMHISNGIIDGPVAAVFAALNPYTWRSFTTKRQHKSSPASPSFISTCRWCITSSATSMPRRPRWKSIYSWNRKMKISRC